MKKILKSIGFILIAPLMLVLLFFFLGWLGKTIEVILLLVLLVWYLVGFQLVSRSEFGEKYWFQTMVPNGKEPESIGDATLFSRYGFCKSGLQWAARLPGCGIHRLPKKRFKLDYEPRLVISMRSKDKDLQKYGKQMLMIDAVVYCELGRDAKSAISAIERGTPTDEKELVVQTNGLVDDAFRSELGDLDWSEATELNGRTKIGKGVDKSIRSKNSYFSLGGINTKNHDVRIKTVDLESKELKKAMAQPDIEKFQAESAIHEAERTLKEAQVLGEIRKKLAEAGVAESEVDEIAHRVYELQVSKDLQVDTGISVVRLVRFQGGSPLAATLGEGLTAWAEGKGLVGPGAKSSGAGENQEDKEGKRKKRKAQRNPLERITETQRRMREDLPIQKDEGQEEEEE